MGIRGELFSKKVLLQNRSYFFNVKENRKGDLYLNIVESKNSESGFERQSVILFAEDLQEFLRGFDESLRVLEKAVHEKRRTQGGGRGGAERPRTGADRPRGSADRPRGSAERPRGSAERPRGRKGADGPPVKVFRKKSPES
jgi:hypothetical protein